MDSEIKWRFPGNGYTQDSGLDTADMETFKKDAISSLAREVCQNSIDAKDPDKSDMPVRIEFETFKISNAEIPGRTQIESEIHACLKTWNQNHKIGDQLHVMDQQIKKDPITCLRISDYNTTGLIGVSTDNDQTAWHYLVHGSGISDKGPTSAGSKGIGKFATFITSYFNTVFYSTYTKQCEHGYEGICKLCSASHEGTTEKTQGIGYFGLNVQNKPIPEEMNIEHGYTRGDDQYGTDIYVLGFKEPQSWKRDLISKILDSFMAAIAFDTLSLKVDGTEINAETLKDIVYDEDLINNSSRKSIVSQYRLLTDKEHRYEDKMTIDGYGDAKLYLIEYDDDEEQYATRNCVMIRYPYMKIKDLNKISVLPCSAMCIIGDNDLNKALRNVENPQHTNWEFNRIDDIDVRTELKSVYRTLTDQIKELITKHLANSDDTKTDLEGAGEYLPIIDESNQKKIEKTTKKKLQDDAHIQKKKVKAKNINLNASIEDENGDGVQVDIMNTSENGSEIENAPSGHNSNSGGNFHGGDNEEHGDHDDTGHVALKHADLRGMSYRFFCFNKSKREYGVSFISDYTIPDAYFELYSVDEAGGKDIVHIESCGINGEKADIINGRTIKFSIEHGKKYSISLVTDQDEMFSGEVKMYAYR